MSRLVIVGLGEVLWDVFPSHKHLGGASTNFAYISSLLGDEGIVASRIGDDDLGSEVLARLKSLGLNTGLVQKDPIHPTGTVQVQLAADGQPTFEFTPAVAWDFLEWTPEWQALAQRADAVCFGSLAQRNPLSHETIQSFVHALRPGTIRVFDINLRQTFYSPEVLSQSVESADILKLNHEEVPLLLRNLDMELTDDLSAARQLCARFPLKLICITRGSGGSLLCTPQEHHEHRGHPVTVADTVGAGDAFTATLVHHYLRGSNLSTMNEAANRMGSWVASRPGATPVLEEELIATVRAAERVQP